MSTFSMAIEEVADLSPTQIAALIEGMTKLNKRKTEEREVGGRLPFVKYGSIKKK